MRRIEQTAMCVLTPACLLGGLLECALTSLAKAGFRVIHSSLIQFRPEHIQGIWHAQLASFGANRVRVMTDHLTHGLSLVVLLRNLGSLGVSAQSRLKTFKGPSDPRCTKSHQLRAQLGALNKMINFVHSPDDTESLFRESSILFGTNWLSNTLSAEGNTAQDGEPSGIVALKRRFFASSVTLSIPHIAIFAKKRLVDRLCSAPNNTPFTLLQNLQQLTERELAWVSMYPHSTGWIALRSFRGIHSDVEPTHAELSSELRHLAECLDTISSPAAFDMYAAIDDILFGRRTSIAPLYSTSIPFFCLDSWETTLLASQALSEAA
jgi:hypothetical protein